MFGQSLDRIRPGAVLGRTIYEDKGRPLLVPGTELTEQHLRSLGARGEQLCSPFDVNGRGGCHARPPR